ncbi:MAG: hypothetical protein K2W95_31710 [Candidatus Obscuribacterales bacterium]|nr:hypothetical protein [Candidatus Obscuribacterales bacterium]
MNQTEALENTERLMGLRLRYDVARRLADRLEEDGNDAAATIAIGVGSLLGQATGLLTAAASNLCHNDFARAALSDRLPAEELRFALETVDEDLHALPAAYGRSEEVCVAAELGKAADQLEVACFILTRAENRLADAEAANC